ncbi:MAG: histidinol-phosphate transaminase [Pseudomonadota bacterium]
MTSDATPLKGHLLVTKPAPRSGLMDITPYKPGKSMVHQGPVYKLSSNESALGVSPEAMQAYEEAARALERYPDSDATALRTVIAGVHNLPADNLIVGAGSDEIIQLLMQGYGGEGDNIVQSRHGFSYYHLAAAAAGMETRYADEDALTASVDALIAAVDARTKLVFLANPNNPTGTVLMRKEVARLREHLPSHILLVLDGAYAEYMDDDQYTDGADLVSSSIEIGADNVVMMRTFSKVYGLAGARVGWAYAPAEVIGVLNRIRGPFNVSAPALSAAASAMADQTFVAQNKAHNFAERQRVTNALEGFGFEVVPSYGNFVLFSIPGKEDAQEQHAAALLAFLEERGVLIRAAASSQLPTHLRVSIGSTQANDKFLEGAKDYAEEAGL